MNKKARIALVVTGIMVLQGSLVPTFAAGPSGTVNYNGQDIRVNNGRFEFNGMAGTIDAEGNFKLTDGTVGNITKLEGINGYKIDGEKPVALAPGLFGTVTYKGEAIRVNNSKFSFGGMTGTIDAQGNFKLSDGTTGNITQLEGISEYQMDGQAPVYIRAGSASTTAPTVITGVNRNGLYSNVDIHVLATSLKDGSYGIQKESGHIANNLQALSQSLLGYSEADFKQFQEYVRTHSVDEIAGYLSQLPPASVFTIDEFRIPAGGTAWRTSPEETAKRLLSNPESIGVAFAQAGITLTNAEISRYYAMSFEQISAELKKLTNSQLEKLQGRITVGNAVCNSVMYQGVMRDECATPGWEDITSYSPEVNRNLTPAEKDAIRRIKAFTMLNVFYKGTSGELSDIGKKYYQPNIGWKQEAFVAYLTDAAIADYVEHPLKGEWAGGSGGSYYWADNMPAASTSGSSGSPSGGVGNLSTVTSPLKVNTKTIINNWITAKIVSKKSTMSAVEYQSFLAGVNSKMNTLKTGTTNVQKINILDYIMAQVTLLQKSN